MAKNERDRRGVEGQSRALSHHIKKTRIYWSDYGRL